MRFDAGRIPRHKQEEWRHTNVAPIAKTVFQLGEVASTHRLSRHRVQLRTRRGLRTGLRQRPFSPQLSKLGKLPRGVPVRTLPMRSTDSATLRVTDHLGNTPTSTAIRSSR